MRKITSAVGGYVYYAVMCDEVGQIGLYYMIEYNILHLQPYFALSCLDLYPLPDQLEAIVTAESKVGLLAMKHSLEDIDKDNYHCEVCFICVAMHFYLCSSPNYTARRVLC